MTLRRHKCATDIPQSAVVDRSRELATHGDTEDLGGYVGVDGPVAIWIS
jgi:hypothetical protein